MFAGAAPEAAKLAGHVELAAEAAKRLESRWSPHAISADPRAGHMTISAEAVYRACYDPTGRRRLPSRHRRRKPRGRCQQAKRSPLGDCRPLSRRPVHIEEPARARALGRRPDHRPQQQLGGGHRR
ncbi:MAG: hypothetical protein OXF75_12170 [Acidimicrobiaceae bacterium]|nr:hypothetical protein [Acidimicrobiaceae bacterium]